MRRIAYSGLLLLFAILLGCASSGQFKKSEKVTLILNDGNKIKCYVTHVGRNQLFFQATRASDAYNYGDMLNTGQIQKIRLANDAEMSVAEYREYRKNTQTASNSQSKVQPEILTFDALFEKLKHKDIDKMSEKEFQYFLMMKEQENMAYQKKLEMTEKQQQTTEIQKLSQELQQLKQKTEVPPAKPVVRAGPVQVAEAVPTTPKSSNTMAFMNLLERTEMTGAFLYRISALEANGRVLAPDEKLLVSKIADSEYWKKQQAEIHQAGESAAKALEQAYLLRPEALRTQLGLVFGPEEMFNFRGLMDQLYQKAGSHISMSYYRNLAQILGDEGGRAVRTLLRHFEAWQYLSARQ